MMGAGDIYIIVMNLLQYAIKKNDNTYEPPPPTRTLNKQGQTQTLNKLQI